MNLRFPSSVVFACVCSIVAGRVGLSAALVFHLGIDGAFSDPLQHAVSLLPPLCYVYPLFLLGFLYVLLYMRSAECKAVHVSLGQCPRRTYP